MRKGDPVPNFKMPSVAQCALVGRFLHHWLFVESAVNTLIIRILRIPDSHGPIFGPNVDFRRKLNILRVSAPLSPHLIALDKTKAVEDLLTSVRSLYADRNNICHYPWYSTPDGKLFIGRMQAVESLVDARVIWTEKQLKWKVKEVDRVFQGLWAIAQKIKPVEQNPNMASLLRTLSEIEQDIGIDSPPKS